MIVPTILEKVRSYAIQCPDNIALENPDCSTKKISYKELFCKAIVLSRYIRNNVRDKEPIVVYGHKNPYMIVCFLACIMSGHAYCPIDVAMPEERIEMILNQTNSTLMFAIDNYKTEIANVVSLPEVISICNDIIKDIPEIPICSVHEEQTFYIIFTSGSTGIPKGVEITANNLDNFLLWSSSLGEESSYKEETVFLNQAPFSFDLSVMDLYTSLYSGSTLCMMDKEKQKNLAEITPFIKKNEINAIVATPSFVNMCLLDKGFNTDNIPKLESFFFCGETLPNKTAKKLLKRFPNAVVQNAYGPTESTVAVSNVRITKDIVEKYDSLPVGKAKPGTSFIIINDNDHKEKGNVVGEVLITGDTLAKGYYKRTDLTDIAFIKYQTKSKMIRAYRTGDLGYLENDQLFYCGRIDFQIKLNGYRIELGDIESCILRQDYVENCIVIPRMNNGEVKALVGVIILENKNLCKEKVKNAIKEALYRQLPSYMVPQNYEFIDAIPMTNNGKVNRKKIKELIEED